MTPTDTSSADGFAPLAPTAMDGATVGASTDGLEQLPVGRKCTRCDRIVFTFASGCPTCGCFLPENPASLKDGRRSRKALQKAREETYQRLCDQWRRADGTLPRELETLLWQKATLLSLQDRAVRWSETTNETYSSLKHLNVCAAITKYAAELRALEDRILELTAAARTADVPPFMVIYELGDEDIERIHAERDPDGPRRLPERSIVPASAVSEPADVPILEPEAVAAPSPEPVEPPKPTPRLSWRMEHLL